MGARNVIPGNRSPLRAIPRAVTHRAMHGLGRKEPCVAETSRSASPPGR